jgi:DNA end-binding protein Ku
LSLVSVPVTAYTTSAPAGGKVHFRQLHEKCKNPIKYQKVCPVHGEVTKDEIVLGYEYEPGHYALVDQAERDAAQGSRERVMSIDTFVDLADIDPIYFDGGGHYLLPENKVAEKPYAVLMQAMTARKCCGIGEFALGEKEQLMLIRPFDGLLLLNSLHYASEIKPADSFQHELSATKVTREELKLAETLIEASEQKSFDLAKYEDDYTAHLQEIIQSKIAGKEVIAPETEEVTPVINLMDALKKSVAQKKKQGDEKPAARTATVRATARKTRPKRKVS